MITNKHITKIVGILMSIAVVICLLGIYYANHSTNTAENQPVEMDYESELFDTSDIISINIIMKDDKWNEMLENATAETYYQCDVEVNGETFYNVAIRPKGNTSLTSIASDPDTDRYSFKLEFDQYVSGQTCFGLDKLILNNNYADATNMKEAVIYDMYQYLDVDASLYNYAKISVNGQYWGVYLALEAVEDSFLARNYGSAESALYKPETMDMGGGQKDMPEGMEDFDPSNFEMPEGMENFDPSNAATPDMSQNSDNTETTESSQNQGDGEMPQMPQNQSDGEMPQMPQNQSDGEMPQMPQNQSDGEMPPMPQNQSDGEMPQMPQNQSDGEMPQMPQNQSDGEMPQNQSDGEMPQMPQNQDSSESSDMSQNQDGKTMPEQMNPHGNMPNMENHSMSGNGADLNYTDDELSSYSTIWDGAMTDTTDADHKRVVTALKNISEGTDLETYMDVDNILKYMAVHTFAVNQDSLSGMMAHNYYLYESKGQLNILPWDYNLSFGGMSMGASNSASDVINYAIDTPFSGTKFFDTLLENSEYLEQYHNYLQKLVNEYINGGRFDLVYSRIRSQIDTLVEEDPTAFYTYDEYDAGAKMLYDTVKLRAESILGQLAGTIPSTSDGQKQDSDSLVDASAIDIAVMGEFSNGQDKGGFGPDSDSENTKNYFPSDTTADTDKQFTSKEQPQKDDNNKGNSDSARMPGNMQMPQNGLSTQSLILWIVCFAVMLIALILVIIYKRKPQKNLLI